MADLRMSKAEVAALDECARSNMAGILYWFRPMTMDRLRKRGLVEKWSPPSVLERPRLKARPWRLTDEGRAQRARLSSISAISTPSPRAIMNRLAKAGKVERSERYSAASDIDWVFPEETNQ